MLSKDFLIILTGYSGVLGQEFKKAIEELNINFERLVIEDSFDNFKNINSLALERLENYTGEKVLIHLGIPSYPRSKKKYQQYIRNSINLFKLSNLYGWKFYFASSLSANYNNRSTYSISKLKLENFFIKNGGNVIKFGLISSNNQNSIINKIRKLSSIIPIEILFNKEAVYYLTTHVNIVNLLEEIHDFRKTHTSNLIVCANYRKIYFRNFLISKKFGNSSLSRIMNLIYLLIINSKLPIFDGLKNLKSGMDWPDHA